MLDKLPAPLRHLLVLFGGTFLGIFVKAIITAGGVTAMHWAATATLALDTSVTVAASSMLVLYITPLTKQYGIFGDGTSLTPATPAADPAPAAPAA